MEFQGEQEHMFPGFFQGFLPFENSNMLFLCNHYLFDLEVRINDKIKDYNILQIQKMGTFFLS